jgi:membrane associated rhomboid family serine protease
MGPLIAIILQTIIYSITNNSTLAAFLNTLISIYVLVSLFSLISFRPNLMKIALPMELPFWAIPLVAIIPLMIISLFVDLPIGNTAHFGGFLFGFCYGLYLKIKYKKKTRLISQYFSK